MMSEEEYFEKMYALTKIIPLKSEYGYGCSEEEFDNAFEFIGQLSEGYFDELKKCNEFESCQFSKEEINFLIETYEDNLKDCEFIKSISILSVKDSEKLDKSYQLCKSILNKLQKQKEMLENVHK